MMTTLLEIQSVIDKLSVAELAELERVVRHELQQRGNTTVGVAVARPRVLGLHAGAWSVADDFDAPLPDDFWLGTDA